ncbi:hypothetical protein EBU99_07225 [bacterium]|nr:hypothetical protein [bacterium]
MAFMKRTGVSQLFCTAAKASMPFIAAVTVVLACSGRQVERESVLTPQESKSVKFRFSTGVADAQEKTATLGLSLLSRPATETQLNSFVTTVEAPGATSYRFALVQGAEKECSGWGAFRATSEPLQVDFGNDGEKKLCLQGQNKEGKLGQVVTIPFVKKSAAEDGPEFTFAGVPAPYTSASKAHMVVSSAEAAQFRANFTSGSECGTLEKAAWQDIDKPIDVNFRYDGAWVLCLDVRDKFGRMNKKIRTYSWTRDTQNPVISELAIPSGATLTDQFSVNIGGSQVDYYQFALVDGVSNCSNANYSPLTAVSEPLVVKVPGDGVRTLCVMAESKSGLRSQMPYSKVIQKVTLKAEIKINDVPVLKSSTGALTPVSANRRFTISGNGLTHYKAITLDYASDCSVRTEPSGAALPIATPIDVAFSNGGIKSLCVWGYAATGSGTLLGQSTPTWLRFYNETTSNSIATNPSLAKPFTLNQAINACSCHEFSTVGTWSYFAIKVSQRLRANTMPPGGWRGTGDDYSSLLAFLATVPGYPVNLPTVIVTPGK